MAKKKVFISFDFENDRQYKYILNGWDNNDNFDFEMDDKSTKEINSWNISVIKANLTKKINEADYTLVIIGKEANKKHKDADSIGYRNWQNFEIAKSVDNGNKLIAVKIDRTYDSPEEIYGQDANWAMSFTQDAILKALGEK